MDTYDAVLNQLDTNDNRLGRIENRVDCIYDRVSEISADIKLLKWKVGGISSGIGAAIGALIAVLTKKFGG